MQCPDKPKLTGTSTQLPENRRMQHQVKIRHVEVATRGQRNGGYVNRPVKKERYPPAVINVRDGFKDFLKLGDWQPAAKS